MLVSPTSIPTSTNTITIEAPAQATYQLSATDYITTLEAELFALKARRPAATSVIHTRVQ